MAFEDRLSRAMRKLVLFLADGTTLDIPLDHERVTVGRHATNDVCLPYPAVSGAHAVLVTVPTGVVLEDLGSTNGTAVNGKRTAKHFLHDGDRIAIGQQELVYLAEVDAGVPAPAGAPAAKVPVAVAESWLSPLGPDGSSGVGNAAAHSGHGNTPERIAAADTRLPAPAPSGPVLEVLTGPNAGRTLMLTKDETLIGRVGRLVVVVRKDDGGYRLSVAEGDGAPRVNGVPVPPAGVALQPGDAVEVAGARLAFREGADSPSIR